MTNRDLIIDNYLNSEQMGKSQMLPIVDSMASSMVHPHLSRHPLIGSKVASRDYRQIIQR